MACGDPITTGITFSSLCTRGENVAGLSKAWWISLSQISAVTYASSTEVITGITFTNAAYKFFKVDLLRNSAKFDEVVHQDLSKGISFYEPQVTLFISKRSAAARLQIQKAVNSQAALIVLDKNLKYWAVGLEGDATTIGTGVDVTEGSANSGQVAESDSNGYTLKFTGTAPSMCKEISSSIISSLVDVV